MTDWTRQPQERKDQKYFFSGQFYATSGVANELHPEEILEIYRDVYSFAMEQNGIDYLQVYTNGKGRKLFVIDNLSEPMIKSGDYTQDNNYCTLLFADEY